MVSVMSKTVILEIQTLPEHGPALLGLQLYLEQFGVYTENAWLQV